jgi:hypothetical protein
VIHWLRHAHASHAIDNGAPITGHADLKTTSVYAHARPGERQQWPVFEDEVSIRGKQLQLCRHSMLLRISSGNARLSHRFQVLTSSLRERVGPRPRTASASSHAHNADLSRATFNEPAAIAPLAPRNHVTNSLQMLTPAFGTLCEWSEAPVACPKLRMKQ